MRIDEIFGLFKSKEQKEYERLKAERAAKARLDAETMFEPDKNHPEYLLTKQLLKQNGFKTDHPTVMRYWKARAFRELRRYQRQHAGKETK